MLNKTTTSTGLLILGLSSVITESSSVYNISMEQSTMSYQTELLHNTFEKFENLDDYIKTNYNEHKIEIIASYQEDYSTIKNTQKFSDTQIDLDKELSDVLDELFKSKLKSSPSKKRF